MLFVVDQDAGNRLVGYLVPDSLTEPGIYAVKVAGEEVFRAETTIVHKDLVAIGRHETGRIGFVITEAQIPGLASIPELDIVDTVTGQLIYRRRKQEGLVQKRVFRLETHLLPLTALDRALEPRFQLWFPHVDRAGAESVHQIFVMKHASIYVSGRVAFPTVDAFADQSKYACVALLHDPYEEMAERLLFLRLVAQRPNRILGERDSIFFADMMAFAEHLDLEGDKALRRAFKHVDSSVASRLANPVVRQLATLDIGEPLDGTSVSKALSALAGFSIVGIRRRPDLFAEALTDLLELPKEEVMVAPPIPAATELADRLRACPEVEDLLHFDLALYHIVSDAFEKSLIASYS
jgi:hypothetical protein